MENSSVGNFDSIMSNLPPEIRRMVLEDVGKEQLAALAAARPEMAGEIFDVYKIPTREFAAAVKKMLPEDKQSLITEYMDSILSETTIPRFAEKQIRNQKLLEAALFFLSDEQMEELKEKFPMRSFHHLTDRNKYLDDLLKNNRIADARRIIDRMPDSVNKDDLLLKIVIGELKNDRYLEAETVWSQIKDPATKWKADAKIMRFLFENDEVAPIREFAKTLTNPSQKAEVLHALVYYEAHQGNWDEVIKILEEFDFTAERLNWELQIFEEFPWKFDMVKKSLEDKRPDVFLKLVTLNPTVLDQNEFVFGLMNSSMPVADFAQLMHLFMPFALPVQDWNYAETLDAYKKMSLLLTIDPDTTEETNQFFILHCREKLGEEAAQELEAFMPNRETFKQEALTAARPESVVAEAHEIPVTHFAERVKEMLPEDKQSLISEYLQSAKATPPQERFRNQKILEAALFFLSDEQMEELKKEFPLRSFEKLANRKEYLSQLIKGNRLTEAKRIVERLPVSESNRDDFLLKIVIGELNNDRYPEAIAARSKIADPKNRWKADVHILQFLFLNDEVAPIRKFAETLTGPSQKREIIEVLLKYEAHKGNWDEVVRIYERVGNIYTIPRLTDKIFEELPWELPKDPLEEVLNRGRPDTFLKLMNLPDIQYDEKKLKRAIDLALEQKDFSTAAQLVAREDGYYEQRTLVFDLINSPMTPADFEKLMKFYKKIGQERFSTYEYKWNGAETLDTFKKLSLLRPEEPVSWIDEDLIHSCRQKLGEEAAQELDAFMTKPGA